MTNPLRAPLSITEVLSWFDDKGIKLKNEWVQSVMSYLGAQATMSSIFEQFVFSRLEDSYIPPMKIPDKATKIVFTKRIVFQVTSALNIGRSLFEQVKDASRREDNLTWFYGEDDENHDTNEGIDESSTNKGKSYIKLTLTDGMTHLKAFEYGRIEGLNDDIPIGTKIIIIDRVMCRKMNMLLTSSNCCILGGGFESIDDEISKIDRLSMLLPSSKKQKIQPYLSKVKKEFDVNQKTISPFLVRLPPPNNSNRPSVTTVSTVSSTFAPSYTVSSSITPSTVSSSFAPSTVSSSIAPSTVSSSIAPSTISSSIAPSTVFSCMTSSTVSTYTAPSIVSICTTSSSTVSTYSIPSNPPPPLPLSISTVAPIQPSINQYSSSDHNFIVPSMDNLPSSRIIRPRNRLIQHDLPPAAVIEPLVKVEEIDDMNESVICMEKGMYTTLINNTIDDSFNTSIISYSPRRTHKPIIPPNAIESMRNSQIPQHDRADIPIRPCVRLVPHSLQDRINASQYNSISKGRNKESRGKRGTVSRSNDSSSRSIASYFNATKRTQMVEPSSRMHSSYEKTVRQRELYEAMEERRRRTKEIEEERRLREDEERRFREEEEKRLRNEEMRRIREEQERRKRQKEEDEMNRIREERKLRVVRHPSLDYIVSTPRPSSYITPPIGIVPFSNQIELSAPIVRSSSNNLLGVPYNRESSPMHLFGSPPRMRDAVIPFKRTKIEEDGRCNDKICKESSYHSSTHHNEQHSMISSSHSHHNHPSYQPQPISNHHLNEGQSSFNDRGHLFAANTNKSQPFNTLYQSRPLSSMVASLEPPSHESVCQEKYLSLKIVRLSDILKQRRYWMISKRVNVAPMYCRVPRDMKAEHGSWMLHINVVDESGQMFRCVFESKMLEELLGFSVQMCQSLSIANDRTQLMKLKEKAVRLLKSFERLDLILTLEITPIPSEVPIVVQIRNLSDALSIC